MITCWSDINLLLMFTDNSSSSLHTAITDGWSFISPISNWSNLYTNYFVAGISEVGNENDGKRLRYQNDN
jgi:hypothetical protein